MTDINETTILSTKPVTKRPRKMARELKAEVTQQIVALDVPVKRKSKADLVLALLQRPEGAMIYQLVTATGWLPHTTRAALTGLKKKGHTITKDKRDDVTCYRIVKAV